MVEFRERCQERLADPEIRSHSNLVHLLNYPYKDPAFIDLLLNPTDGSFYAERSPGTVLDQIECPVYLCGAWGGTHADPSYAAYRAIGAPKKLLMVPSGGMERPFHEYHGEMLRWFDYHLKRANRIMDEPPITLQVEGVQTARKESQLVPPDTEWRTRYLRSHGRLLESSGPGVDASTSFAQEPPTATAEAAKIQFRSKVFDALTVDLGPSEVRFFAAIDAEDTNWIVLLRKVDQTESHFLT